MLRYFFNLCTIKVLSFSLVLEVVHWMTECSRLSTVTLLEERLYLESVLIRNYHRIFALCADPMHQRCSLNATSGCDSFDVYQFTFKNQLKVGDIFLGQTDLCTLSTIKRNSLLFCRYNKPSASAYSLGTFPYLV